MEFRTFAPVANEVELIRKAAPSADLQDEKKRTLINADDALKVVFGGKKQVSMFE
jgi:chromatin remodeling complex protein RSC6